MFWPRLISAAMVLASCFSVFGVGVLAFAGSPAQPVAKAPVERVLPELVGPIIPKPTGTCPRFVNGRVTFRPAGIAPRKVLLFTGKRVGGPLVIYWHGMGGKPEEALSGLGRKVIEQITAQGGVVAAPTPDPGSKLYPWYLVSTTREDDLLLTDEIVACAHQVKHIDPEHIHAIGMSAGGLQATQLGPRRSNYMASIVAYSGGLVMSELTPPFQAPANKFPALLFHGGPRDEYIVNFQRTTQDYARLLRHNGHDAIVCDHRAGHVIPRGGGSAAYRFFMDHPFGLRELSPELVGEPRDYCELEDKRSAARAR